MNEILERAYEHLSEVCADFKNFKMSIPVHKNDSDEIFGEAFNYAEKLEKEIIELKSELEEYNKICDGFKESINGLKKIVT